MITLIVDGSCIGNPGPGGWACIIRSSLNGSKTELQGQNPATTNNRMELTAAINGLSAINAYQGVTVRTDSKYVMDGATKWIFKWRVTGWKTSTKADVANRDLWEELSAQVERFGNRISFEWVKGHAGDEDNERCDWIAQVMAHTVGVTKSPDDQDGPCKKGGLHDLVTFDYIVCRKCGEGW